MTNDFQTLYSAAYAAGRNAALRAEAAGNIQMIRIAGSPQYAPFPICGFAWVNVKPGTSAFAKWLIKENHAHKAYRGGVDIWISDYNQSYDLKFAHAAGMATYLSENGITCCPDGRLD